MPHVRMIECLLCGKIKAHKSRNLCLACYQRPESKPLKIKIRHRVERDTVELPPPTEMPDSPTDALPGSQEKIEVMSRRYQSGKHLHHPDDAVINFMSYLRANPEDGPKRRSIKSLGPDSGPIIKKINLDISHDDSIDF